MNADADPRVAGLVGRGDRLGDNRLDAPAGQGGMGVVFRATQLDLGRTVAVKVISPALAADPVFRERFAREVRLLAAVDHPHVIPIHQAGESRGLLYLSMRWIEGPSLGEEIRVANGLDPQRALRILGQVAAALDAVHARGLVHRDVKPSNVLIEQRAGGEHAYLTDFGAGRQLDVDSDATGTGQWLGTVDYVAPEILAGEPPGARSDVYSLGCVLFEALAATPPFRRDSPLATMLAHQNEPAPSLRARRPHLPPSLDAVVARALAKAPDQRYPTAQRLLQAADDALRTTDGPQTAAGPVSEHGSPRGPRRVPAALSRAWRAQRTRTLVVGGGVLAAAVVAAVLVASGGSPAGAPSVPVRQLSSAAKVARITPVAIAARASGPVAADDGAAFVLDRPARAVRVVDSLSRTRLGTIKLPGTPLSVASDDADKHDRLWVGLAGNRLIETPRLRSHVSGAPIALPIRPDDLVVTDKALVVAQRSPLRLVRVDPVSRRVIGRVVTPGGSAVRVIGEGSSLVALLTKPNKLLYLDQTLAVDESHGFKAGRPVDIAQGPGAIGWILDAANDSVVRIDVITGERKGLPIRVGHDPVAIADDTVSVWVTNRGDASVTRIRDKTGQPFGPPIPTGPLAGPIAARQGIENGAWVTTPKGLLELEIPSPPYE